MSKIKGKGALVLVTLTCLFITSILGEDSDCPSYSCPRVLCDLKKKEVQGFCDNVKCVGISVDDCRPPLNESLKGQGQTMYQEHLTMCGCCPGCARYLALDDECSYVPSAPTQDPECQGKFCSIRMNRCAPGLECKLVGPSELRCSFKTVGASATSCSDKRALSFTGDLKHWTPQCEVDGSYSPKQCKKGPFAPGICFCVDPQGKRIFGTQQQNKATNQTCQCSRQAHQLRLSGHIASLHCSPDGNYEPLQCDTETGLCYCVNPETGLTTGAVLPESQWKSLPCFSINYTNFDPEGGYYRKCESEWAIARKLSIEASLHGLTVLSGRRVTCDPDGSYAPVQNIEKITSCVDKAGLLIGNNREREDSLNFNCQCVRDEIKAIEDGIPFLKLCQIVTGNYDVASSIVQTPPYRYMCVDPDGIFYGDEAEEAEKCCLYSFGDDRNCNNQPPAIRDRCYDPTASAEANEGKIHPCSYWPT